MATIYGVSATPHPSRLLEGLRDTGYDFNTAISDIVDNSIAAEANKVYITATQNMDGNISVKVADNGCGMTREELIAAMTYGAPARKNRHSLGKFGLGLKTASTSCCRCLKLVSRAQNSDEVNCAIWDLDHIREVDKWDLQLREATQEEIHYLDDVAGHGPGTLVVWDKVDRLLSARYSNSKSKAYQAAFQNSLIALRQHLAMVFQRFLDESDNRAETVLMKLNGEQVLPWDPFCKELGDALFTERITVGYSDGGKQKSDDIELSAYIVPNKSELSTDEERQRVMPSYRNKALKGFDEESLSGFYIYRENRLISWGKWFNMPGVDFHAKLCRFELSFGADLDDAFQIDIKKSRILVSDELREELLHEITSVKNEGVRRYRGNTAKAAKKQGKALHEQSNDLVAQQEPGVSKSRYGHDAAGKPTVSNRFGTHLAPYEENTDPSKRLVEVVDSITDSALWVPFIGENDRHGVQLNSSHPFYQKFYGNNRKNDGATLAMDLVFWALAEAESEAYEPEASENLEEARIATSRVLRRISRELPDASVEDFEDKQDD